MTHSDLSVKTGHRFSRVVARVFDRMFVTADGELVDGGAADGERVVIFEPSGHDIEIPTKLAGGLPVKEGMSLDDDAEHTVRFRLCLDGAEREAPYSGWLGRLLVLENGSRPRLYAVPHDPRYPGYKSAFGCHLIWAHDLCRAPAECRNNYGETPCEAPSGYTCDKTFKTCKDRRNFAPCPHTFGEYPCLAEPSQEPCAHSARTCRAVGKGDYPSFGDNVYAAFGSCRNTRSTCESFSSFMPFSPEFHAYGQFRNEAPFGLSLHAASRGRCAWLGKSQDTYEGDSGSSTNAYSVSRVWIAINKSIRLPRTHGAVMIPTIPSSALLEQMLATDEASGVGVADISYSIGAPVSGNSHHLASVQWVTSSAEEEWPPVCVVLNSSPDGETWSDDGETIYTDNVEVTYDESAPTWPTRLARTEYRMPRVVNAAGGNLLIYTLMGQVVSHTEVTSEGGRKRIYDEMFIKLACNGQECTFDPPMIIDGYIPAWPQEPDGFIRLGTDLPSGALVSTFSFRFGGAGSPTGVYEVGFERGGYHAFIPVKLVLGRRSGPNGTEAVTVPVLMRYVSDDGVSFGSGTIMKDDGSHFLTCVNSVPVCRHWTGAACSKPDGFCGAVGPDGGFASLFPHCDGQGTGGAPGESKWSRYESGAGFRGPGRLDRAGRRGNGPPFALAGCNQRGAFGCRLKKAGYEGQWCARLPCSGFQPRGLWGSGGIKILDLYNNDI